MRSCSRSSQLFISATSYIDGSFLKKHLVTSFLQAIIAQGSTMKMMGGSFLQYTFSNQTYGSTIETPKGKKITSLQ